MLNVSKNKLVLVLNSLSKAEHRLLKKYIHKNASATHIKLYAELLKQKEENLIVVKADHILLKKVLSPSNRNLSALSTNLSKLFSIVTRFLVLNHHDLQIIQLENYELKKIKALEKEIEDKIKLLKFYTNRELIILCTKVRKEIETLFDSFPIENSFISRSRYIFEQVIFSLEGRYSDNRKGDINFQNQSNLLDRSYILEKLILLCHVSNRQLITDIDFNPGLKNELLAFIPTSVHFKDIQIKFWYDVLSLLAQKKNADLFHTIYIDLTQNTIHLSIENKRVVFTILENLAKINTTSTLAYYNILFNVYSIQDKHDVFICTNTLVPVLFLNIVNVGLRLKEYQWVSTFVHDNIDKIVTANPEERNMVADVALLSLYIAKKDLKQIESKILNIDLDKEIRYKDVKNNTAIRRNIIRGHYELGEYESCLSSIGAYKRFISYHKAEIHPPFDKANSLFIIYINKILDFDKVYRPKKEQEIDVLYAKLAQEKVVYDKMWLLDKINAKRNVMSQANLKVEELITSVQKYYPIHIDRIKNISEEYNLIAKDSKMPIHKKNEIIKTLSQLNKALISNDHTNLEVILNILT